MKRGRTIGLYLLTALTLCALLAGCRNKNGKETTWTTRIFVCDQCKVEEFSGPDHEGASTISPSRTSILSSGNILNGLQMDGVECHSSKAKEGEVKTEPTIQELGWIDQAKGEVGVEERPREGQLVAKFMCGENTVEVRGALVGALTPINKKVTPTEHFTIDAIMNEAGEPLYPKLEGGPAASYEIQVNDGGFSRFEFGDLGELTPSATVEVSTASGKPMIVTAQEAKKKEREEAKKRKEEERKKRKEEKPKGR